MGCDFCRRKKRKTYSEEGYEDVPLYKNSINSTLDNINKNIPSDEFEEEKAKELVKYLLSNDFKFYKNQLFDVINLSSKEFRILFNGDSDYIYNVKNQKDFKKLALKFENFSLLLNEWYQNDKEYYECLRPLWKDFTVLNKLANLEDDELEKKLEFANYHNWDKKIKDEFKGIINNTDDISHKFKIFINEKYKELDDVIKNLQKAKKSIEVTEKKEETKTKNFCIKENIDIITDKIIENLVPVFFNSFNAKKEKEEEKNGKKQDSKKTELTNNQTNKLIKNVAKMYITGEIPKDFDAKKTLNEIQTLVKNINCIKFFQPKSEIKGFIDKKFIAYGILGLSYLNLCYNIFSTYTFIVNSDTKIEELEKKLNQIKEDYRRHKKEINILPTDDIEEAMRKIEEIRLKFEEDKANIKKLIEEIESEIKNQKSQKNKGFLKIFSSVGVMGMNTILANTSSNSKTEYGLSALFNGISVATDVTAIVKITKNVERLKKLLDEAKEEEENIKKGIEELNKKYINYQKKINPNEYK